MHLGNHGSLSLLEAIAQKVVLNWTLPDDGTFDPKLEDIRVNTWCVRNIAPSRVFQYSSAFKFYEALPDEQIMQSGPCKWPMQFDYDILRRKKNEIHVSVISVVEPGELLEIEVVKTPRNQSSSSGELTRKSAKITLNRSKRLLYLPVAYPKAGAGCFQILEANATTRRVQIFWRKAEKFNVRVDVYEKRGNGNYWLSSEEKGTTDTMICTISLERHYFVVSSYDKSKRFFKSDVINVPPQREILPKPVTLAHFNPQVNINTLTWRKPENLTGVQNYTIFMIDEDEEKDIENVFDYVYYIPDDEISLYKFETRANRLVRLGISVNTNSSSSGVYDVPQI